MFLLTDIPQIRENLKAKVEKCNEKITSLQVRFLIKKKILPKDKNFVLLFVPKFHHKLPSFESRYLWFVQNCYFNCHICKYICIQLDCLSYSFLWHISNTFFTSFQQANKEYLERSMSESQNNLREMIKLKQSMGVA